MSGIFGETSVSELCITLLSKSAYPDAPHLRVSPRSDGSTEFRYFDAYYAIGSGIAQSRVTKPFRGYSALLINCAGFPGWTTDTQSTAMTARVDTSSAILPPTPGNQRFLRVAILSFLCGLLLFQRIEKLRAQSVNHQAPTPDAAPDGKPTDGARPSGITQSAENNEFGRRVVRSMRRTMPRLRTTGRVTIRLFLDEHGKLHKIRVIKTEGDARIEKTVLNAAKGTSFPVPPVGSTIADLTFLVHYIYK